MTSDKDAPRRLDKQSMGITDGLPLQVCEGGLEDLRADIQRLMDIEAIKQIKHRYFRCLDTANWEELQSILHPELKVHYIGGGYEFKFENNKDFIDTMQQAFNNDAVGRHNGSMPEIQMLSASEATGIWYLYDHFWSLNAKHLTHGTALYWDSYVKTDGQWLIKETSYKRIYQINETLAAKPTLASHYLGDLEEEKA